MNLALAAVLLAAAVSPALADPEPTASEEPVYHCNTKQPDVTITFKPEIEIRELITWAVGFTCKRFTYDTRIVPIGKKVTVIAPQRLARDDAYQVFLAALETAGLAVVPKGGTLTVVDAQAAKKESLPIYKKELPPSGEQVVRYVVRPTFVQAETLKTAFLSLKSDAGDVISVGQLVMITDYASHVRDMASLLSLVDVPGGTDGIYTIPVLHADAAKLADKLDKLLAPAQKDLPATKIMVDERTNTLIVSGSEVGYRRAKALVDRLDISLAMEDGASMHVYQLGSAIAEELAATLEKSIQKTDKKTSTTPAASAPGAVLDGLATLDGPVHVIGDKSTNALIITASAHDFLAMKDIIRQLDQPRRQVYIEAMILEVAVGDQLQMGTSSHGGYQSGSSLLLGGVQTGGTSTLDLGTEAGATSLAGVTGLVAGIVGKSLASSSTLLGTSIPSYAVLFNAVATQGDTEIVSEPSIIALDNEEAKYKVGTNIPYQRGISYPTSGTSTIPTNNIERTDLALELDIKPHISTEDTVLLEIKHGSKDLGDDTAIGPTWSTRELETRVLVRDQHTVVIGGLMQTKNITSKTQVPILGDIPILGNLFKYTKTTKKKTDLLILLTPYIIRDQSDLERIRERKARQHEEFVQSYDALSHAAYVAAIDYTRKRGLLEEINRTLADVEHDAEARRLLTAPLGVAPGLVEVR